MNTAVWAHRSLGLLLDIIITPIWRVNVRRMCNLQGAAVRVISPNHFLLHWGHIKYLLDIVWQIIQIHLWRWKKIEHLKSSAWFISVTPGCHNITHSSMSKLWGPARPSKAPLCRSHLRDNRNAHPLQRSLPSQTKAWTHCWRKDRSVWRTKSTTDTEAERRRRKITHWRKTGGRNERGKRRGDRRKTGTWVHES